MINHEELPFIIRSLLLRASEKIGSGESGFRQKLFAFSKSFIFLSPKPAADEITLNCCFICCLKLKTIMKAFFSAAWLPSSSQAAPTEGQRAQGRGQRAKSRGQRAQGREQRAESKERRAESDEATGETG
jgi:hypothetical protein